MKNTILITVTFLCISITAFSQFSSVQNGNWSDASTWSTDPDATAVPDSMSSVTINHGVLTFSMAHHACYNLTINKSGHLYNWTSMWSSGNLYVKNNIYNYGLLKPSKEMVLTIGGTLYNYGIISNKENRLDLWTKGQIKNYGTFQVSQTRFIGQAPKHSHSTYSITDSVLHLGETSFNNSTGELLIDSVITVQATFNLNQSSIVIPVKNGFENKLKLSGTSYIDNGTVYANGNTIETLPGSVTYLCNYRGQGNGLRIENAILDGKFPIAGNIPSGSGPILTFSNVQLKGKIIEWFSSNTQYSDDRWMNIEGEFINDGEIYNVNNDNILINLKPNSTFRNNGSRLDPHTFRCSGNSLITGLDSAGIRNLIGIDSTTYVTIEGNTFFKNTVKIDFNNGQLALPENGIFKTTYQWYNSLNNTRIEANNCEISYAIMDRNVIINNPSIGSIYFRDNLKLTGKVINKLNMLPESRSYPLVTIEGDLDNYGRIRNLNWGYLDLKITGNLKQYGEEWSNRQTTLIGKIDQYILLKDTTSITGKVTFEAMLEGDNYQWQKNGEDIAGATNKQLTFNNGLSLDHSGTYVCKVNWGLSRKIFVGEKLPLPFEIRDVVIKNVDDSTTLVLFKTSVPTNGFIFSAETDTSSGFPLEAMEDFTVFKTDHRIKLEHLKKDATYYFYIWQQDEKSKDAQKGTFRFVAGDLSIGALTINSIVDVPEDQGGWVYVNFDADITDAFGDINSYGIWEWMNDEWVSLGYVPANQSERYTYLAHTYKDSTVHDMFWSKFYVSSHSVNPLIHYSSKVDSGYSLDNIAPAIPTGVRAQISTNLRNIELSWDTSNDTDFNHFIVYRNGIKYATTIESNYVDTELINTNLEYHVIAVDYAGNSSQISNKAEVSVGIKNTTTQNVSVYPNPASSSITIAHLNSQAQYRILDLTGKVIQEGIINQGTSQINVSTLNDGVYLMEIIQSNKRFTEHLVIKK